MYARDNFCNLPQLDEIRSLLLTLYSLLLSLSLFLSTFAGRVKG